MINNTLMIAVCDDSIIDREILIDFINEYLDKKNLVAQIDRFSVGADILKYPDKYDIAFMDIYMPVMSGIEVIKKLNEAGSKTINILCTCSKEYIDDAYILEVLHYFVKPVSQGKLDNVMNRFLSRFTTLQNVELKIGRSTEIFFIDQILYFESMEHHCIVHTQKNDEEISESFNQICKRMQVYDFVKISRTTVASIRHIASLTVEEVTLDNGEVLPLSETQKDEVKQAYAIYKKKHN